MPSNEISFENVVVKEEPLDETEDGATGFGDFSRLSDKRDADISSSVKSSLSKRKKIKAEIKDEEVDGGAEFTDAELRSHNLSDFLDSSPRIKDQSSLISPSGKKVDNNIIIPVISDMLPPLINMKEEPLCSFPPPQASPPLSPCVTPVKHQHHHAPLSSSTPIRQSPRLHQGSLQLHHQRQHLLSESSSKHSQQQQQPVFSGQEREKAVHLAKELNSLLANASQTAQRLTDLVMENSLAEDSSSDRRYQDGPPILEPELPIISPTVSRRLSSGEGGATDNDNNIFTNIFGAAAGEYSSQFQRRTMSVDETSDYLGKPLSLLARVKDENELCSNSDGFRCSRRRNSTEEFGRPPLLKKDFGVDVNNSAFSDPLLQEEEKPFHSPKHFHVGEDIYLKSPTRSQTSSKRSSSSASRRNLRRQPKLIFRMKPDPELKKQLREERPLCRDANLQFKWDDDSDVELGRSPTYSAPPQMIGGDFGRSPSHHGNSSSSSGVVTPRGKDHGELHQHQTEGDTVDGVVAAPHSLSNSSNSTTKSNPHRKVRKVRLKMFDTQVHFDLVSPCMSPSN